MDDTVVVTLFRHGLTEGNKRKAYMGWNDSPLCEEAVSKLSSYTLDAESYDMFLSSDLNRCLHTMKILFPTVEPDVVPEFREMHFGEFQGLTYEDLKEDKNYQLWVKDPVANIPPSGESFTQFTERVDKGWQNVIHQILEKNVRHPVIVTHGGVVKYLLSKYAPTEKDFWDWGITHGSGYELTFSLDELRRGGRCISLREVPLTEKENG